MYTRLLGRLLAPVVESALDYVCARRNAQANAAGLGALDRLYLTVIGGGFSECSPPPEAD